MSIRQIHLDGYENIEAYNKRIGSYMYWYFRETTTGTRIPTKSHPGSLKLATERLKDYLENVGGGPQGFKAAVEAYKDQKIEETA